jgi:hypothetical protein
VFAIIRASGGEANVLPGRDYMTIWGGAFYTVRGSIVRTRTFHFIFGALHRATVELVIRQWSDINHVILAHQQQRVEVIFPDGEYWASCAILTSEPPIVNYPTTYPLEIVRHW